MDPPRFYFETSWVDCNFLHLQQQNTLQDIFIRLEPHKFLVRYARFDRDVEQSRERIQGKSKTRVKFARALDAHSQQNFIWRIPKKTWKDCFRLAVRSSQATAGLKCPATIMERQQHFGKDDVDLGILSRDPERSLAFAKATLLWDVPHNNNNNRRVDVRRYSFFWSCTCCTSEQIM